ncbi:MAG: hypothetical protein ACOY3N_23465 [Bradyrhizobium sp.]|uniref:hypothetical protein n=1 Tax=Bradyrhizobium sp. TaxID=376 RepID=UPI003BF20162
MTEIVFLNDTAIPREHFEALPVLTVDGISIAEAVIRQGGKLCRAVLDRDGRAAWHALAWLHFNGTKRVTATRVKLGRYQEED